ncbi:hypothetical protein TanjilG_32861 [Lupinus angustifolius]|uniref:Fucosyltransferase n=1 Tax=Lupinus angustifolius TaxID=3871 RepID=A0A4P1RSE4_LUPAN|nr:hypothetical protein TanjilG_32861 [Lupinus angustifolius]
MDMIQGTFDNIGLNSKKKLTAFFIVLFIAIPVTLIVTKKLSNSSFTIFEGSSQNKVLEGESAQKNGTTELLNDKSNVTNNGSGLKGIVQKGTDREIITSKEGDRNKSITNSSNVPTPHTTNPDDKDKGAPSTSPSNVSTPDIVNPDGKDKNASTSPPNVSTPHIVNPDDKNKNASSTSAPNVSTRHNVNPDDKDKNASSTSPPNVSTSHTANPHDKDKNASSTSPPNVSIPHTANPDAKGKNASLASPPNVSTPHIVNSDDKKKNASSTSSSDSRSIPIHDDRDKLIDGLLASGFDEASCTSRFQSHLFRKASPHKPSQYLVSKLRHYEELHRKCGPNSRAYRKSMKVLHSKKKGAPGICKYLVWTPANGLGNRMISLAAAFLYAIFADRVLLVRFRDDMQGLFCEPFLNSTWLLPKHSPFWSEHHVETYRTMLKKDKASHSKRAVPSTLFLNLQHSQDDPEKFFHCDHNQDLLRNITSLILRSDQYFVPYLFMNPSFNSEIDKMFPEKDAIFHHLVRYLFHPSNEAWGLISRFYKTYLASADERIGLQIRVFSPTTTPTQAVMDLVLNCTLSNKVLPQLDTQKSVYYSQNQTVKAVLVASLYPEYGENLRAMYLNKPSVSGELIGVYQPSHEEEQKFHDNMHNFKAWTEMYLLSLSDVLVTTSLSTFGYVAQGLGGLKPWLLYKLTSNDTYFPACVRDFSIEPCNHIPPQHFCNGKPIKDFASSFPYLRKCLDFYAGVKLANSSST